MKIAIVAAVEKISLATGLIQSLSEAGNAVYGLKFNSSWQNETKQRIDRLFASASHVLCVVSTLSTVSSWLPFVIGYGRGENRRLALYRSDPEWQPPPWISDLPVFDSESEVIAYYHHERQEWDVLARRRLARTALLEMGISYHADALAECIKEGDIKAVELFLDSGYPVDVRDKHGVPLLCQAARSRHLSVLKDLLERGADINLQSEDRGYSALMDAAQAGDEATVRFLLEQGAEPDLVSKDGQTALVLAVGRADQAVVALLREFGANPDIPDKLGFTARRYAKLFKQPAICELFGPDGSD
ncbi:MAG: hypothetical protein A2087_14005 [Spirochaetes bacterium GWD1_61_31]|nr:MAG: hypothetical protein A2Y37_00325 [Spirochaetes bacterium GWB1_60_80]OHD28914.1 MAG: hypothetical protein A2004_10805 [Spirochaetes bacterium GWC1_61_12]OHD40529.1 MAG: hypothetical protein A2087_14005 [Spirochaetes bacterium GWD1_61_31]OHD43551.1 MAG: hypothetical protein A2Y35_04735 [Spirochaetes bacterium GWE1_60_18]OHD59018.1 MAG: hypothetical protein A2Y32_01930 [Spirochaetes bacterium GWF1_60_12]